MSREIKYTAIILKKQPYKEGDEIITLFTKEGGKVRGLAKSVKSPKSKLQQKLQALFLVNLTLAGNKMPKIISAETVKVFANMRENLDAIKMAFYALEMVLKLTADEEKNEPLFNLLQRFLDFLDSPVSREVLNLGLAKFKIQVLESSGLGLQYPEKFDINKSIYFSSGMGGFMQAEQTGGLQVFKSTFEIFLVLIKTDFQSLPGLPLNSDASELQNILSKFIEYQLERRIKSETYLRQP